MRTLACGPRRTVAPASGEWASISATASRAGTRWRLRTLRRAGRSPPPARPPTPVQRWDRQGAYQHVVAELGFAGQHRAIPHEGSRGDCLTIRVVGRLASVDGVDRHFRANGSLNQVRFFGRAVVSHKEPGRDQYDLD